MQKILIVEDDIDIHANYIQVALLYYSCPQEGSYNF